MTVVSKLKEGIRNLSKVSSSPPSSAKHLAASLAKRLGGEKPREGPIPEHGGEPEQLQHQQQQSLDKSFGYGKNFGAKYELGKEVGRGHFGHTCSARVKKGEFKDQPVAVKIISKAKVRVAEYNNVRSQLNAINRKQSGSLAVRDLSNLVKPEDVIDSEHLITLLAIVPKYSQKDWLASYETLTSYVVPRSSKKLYEDNEYALYTVTLFRRVK